MPIPNILESSNAVWDFVIIGTGMGGATLGYALAKAGKTVLFCEKGKSYLSSPQALRGDYAEVLAPLYEPQGVTRDEILHRAGRCAEPVVEENKTQVRDFIPFLGCGTGGSTALYGMAMERFSAADFSPRNCHPLASEATLPANWPISHKELQPYYEAAEKLFRVRGTADPLRGTEHAERMAPPPLSSLNQELYEFLQHKGLHPYRLPMACEYVPGCRGCQGYLCDKNCKNDSTRICLEPALSLYGAKLLDECEVLSLKADRNMVTSIECSKQGKKLSLKGKVVVLAAGALATPRILLNSVSPEWPGGLANESGLIGRNLMRHYVDLYAVFTKSREKPANNIKELAFNDLYMDDGEKFGSVQSFGAMIPPRVIVDEIEQDLRQGSFGWATGVFKLIKPIISWLLGRLFARTIILAATMEDLPYKENRLAYSKKADGKHLDKCTIHYRIHAYDKLRITAFRKRIKQLLSPYRFILIKRAEDNRMLAHACGTCRFGSNPNTSVLDKNNKAHGISNLYIVDSSFFSSSGGTNPSLTIAANALRVADHMLKQES